MVTDALSKFKGPYRAEEMYVRDADGFSVVIVPCQGDPAADFSLAEALASRLNEADEMEKIISQAREYAQRRQGAPIGKWEQRIEDAGWTLAESVRAFDARSALPEQPK